VCDIRRIGRSTCPKSSPTPDPHLPRPPLLPHPAPSVRQLSPRRLDGSPALAADVSRAPSRVARSRLHRPSAMLVAKLAAALAARLATTNVTVFSGVYLDEAAACP
jgi:hypothetical protein